MKPAVRSLLNRLLRSQQLGLVLVIVGLVIALAALAGSRTD